MCHVFYNKKHPHRAKLSDILLNVREASWSASWSLFNWNFAWNSKSEALHTISILNLGKMQVYKKLLQFRISLELTLHSSACQTGAKLCQQNLCHHLPCDIRVWDDCRWPFDLSWIISPKMSAWPSSYWYCYWCRNTHCGWQKASRFVSYIAVASALFQIILPTMPSDPPSSFLLVLDPPSIPPRVPIPAFCSLVRKHPYDLVGPPCNGLTLSCPWAANLIFGWFQSSVGFYGCTLEVSQESL